MPEKIVQRRISIPDDRVAEARHDLDMLFNPQNLITYNDGYYAKSLEQKWRMSTSDLQELVGKPVFKVEWQ